MEYEYVCASSPSSPPSTPLQFHVLHSHSSAGPCFVCQSHNHSAWKIPPRPSSPAIPSALLRPPVAHVPECHIHTASAGLGAPPLQPMGIISQRGHHFPMWALYPSVGIISKRASKPALAQVSCAAWCAGHVNSVALAEPRGAPGSSGTLGLKGGPAVSQTLLEP